MPKMKVNELFTMIEEGVDVRWTEFGQLQIQTNDPNGYTTQRFTLRPATALKLCAWLEDRDTDEIRRRALVVDLQAFNPEADAAFRARRGCNSSSPRTQRRKICST
jgi:hypothetical protein